MPTLSPAPSSSSSRFASSVRGRTARSFVRSFVRSRRFNEPTRRGPVARARVCLWASTKLNQPLLWALQTETRARAQLCVCDDIRPLGDEFDGLDDDDDEAGFDDVGDER